MCLLKAEHITKKYSGRTIIKDINIELHINLSFYGILKLFTTITYFFTYRYLKYYLNTIY